MTERDTIAAIATPPGRGGIGVIRLSGPRVEEITRAAIGKLPSPRIATLATMRDAAGTMLDRGVVLYFPAPHSFTGEAVIEFQGHGGPVILDGLLARWLELGARLARPGEFSERAFINDKLDLTQAEAIADLIDASSAQAARAALRSLDGAFSNAIRQLVDRVIALRSYIEAALDFSDEEIDFLTEGNVTAQLTELGRELVQIIGRSSQGRLLRDGLTVVLAGQPNAGKSSLLNALAGVEAAIVTDVPGTTRDVLRERMNLDGMPLHVVDTAGLRDSDDPIEQEGMRRARAEIEKADCVLLLVDDRFGITPSEQAILATLPAQLPITVVHNKSDLTGHNSGNVDGTLRISAKTGAGMDALRTLLKQRVGYAPAEDAFLARRRHLDALHRAQQHLAQAVMGMRDQRGAELIAEELRMTQNALNEITGVFTSDDLLGKIFSSFCIGK